MPAVHYYHLLPHRSYSIRSALLYSSYLMSIDSGFVICQGCKCLFRLRLSHSGICSYRHLSWCQRSGTGFPVLFALSIDLVFSASIFAGFLLPCRYFCKGEFIYRFSPFLKLVNRFQFSSLFSYLLLLRRLLCRLFCLLSIRSAGFSITSTTPHTHRFRLCHMSGHQR